MELTHSMDRKHLDEVRKADQVCREALLHLQVLYHQTSFQKLSNYIAWRVMAEYVRAKILALRDLKVFKDRKPLKLL